MSSLMRVALVSEGRVKSLPDPPGFSGSKDKEDKVDLPASNRLMMLKSQAQSAAMAPAGGLLQTAFMLWMCGSSIGIWSIMMTANSLMGPVKALAGISQYFAKFEKEEGLDLTNPKLIYAAVQCVGLAMALYKCSTLGLLPLTSADWTTLIPIKVYKEYSGIPL